MSIQTESTQQFQTVPDNTVFPRRKAVAMLNDFFATYQVTGMDCFIEGGLQVAITPSKDNPGGVMVEVITRVDPVDLARVSLYVVLVGKTTFGKGKVIGFTDFRRSDSCSGRWLAQIGMENSRIDLETMKLFAVDMRLPTDV